MRKIHTVTYHGRLHTFRSLSDICGINRKTLWHRWNAAGRPSKITASLLGPSNKPTKQPKTLPLVPKTYKPVVDRSPGWMERKMFPHAGKNGSCKVERVNESCLGMLGPMPIMGDMP